MAEFFDITEDDISGLEQKIAIITGGSSGIGFATSELFSTKGAIVVQADLSPPPRILPGSVYIKTDVTSWTDLTCLFRKVINDYGRVDIVFANAGVGPKGNYRDLTVGEDGVPMEPSRLCLEINLIAVTNTVALALHYMQRQDAGGNVVMTTSVAGYQPFGHEDYTVSKHGVVGILRGLREHFSPNRHIRINAIAPSWTDTTIIGLPIATFEKVGLDVQPPSKVALAVGLLVTDPNRHAQTIYIVNGRYKEIEAEIMATTAVAMGFKSIDETEAGRFQDLVKAFQETL